jgi:hypothetical protein
VVSYTLKGELSENTVSSLNAFETEFVPTFAQHNCDYTLSRRKNGYNGMQICSLRRHRRRNSFENAAEDGGLSLEVG